MFRFLKSKKVWILATLAFALNLTVLNSPVKAGGDGPFPLAFVAAHKWVAETAEANFYVRFEPLIVLPNGDTSVRIEMIDAKTNNILSFGTGLLKKDATSIKARLTDYKHRSQTARLSMAFNSESDSYLMHLTVLGNVSNKQPKTIILRQKPF